MNGKRTVLVVDDEAMIRSICVRSLGAVHDVVEAENLEEARRRLDSGNIDVCLCDVRLPDGNGVEELAAMRRLSPATEFVFMTGNSDISAAVAAVKGGAYDFLLKPFESLEKVAIVIDKALERRTLREQADRLQQDADRRSGFDAVIGASRAMQRALSLARDVAHSASGVLLQGESGTGKEVVARAIHQASPRSKGPFVVVNCGALPEALIESELFGHERGSFTNAFKDKRGLFEEANGGTIFLDEIGEMPLSAQVRLLRVLQSGEVRRVGATDSKKVNVRVIAATNADLKKMIAENRFREDLFYRLQVIGIELPALRARRDDIPMLAMFFLERSAKKAGKEHLKGFADDAMLALLEWNWPGNVRELENVVERAVVIARGNEIEAGNLPEALFAAPALVRSGDMAGPTAYKEARDRAAIEFERGYVSGLLRMTEGNMTDAARVAGLDRSNFRKIVLRSGVDYREFLRRRRAPMGITGAEVRG